jgi:hypothetical protein
VRAGVWLPAIFNWGEGDNIEAELERIDDVGRVNAEMPPLETNGDFAVVADEEEEIRVFRSMDEAPIPLVNDGEERDWKLIDEDPDEIVNLEDD